MNKGGFFYTLQLQSTSYSMTLQWIECINHALKCIFLFTHLCRIFIIIYASMLIVFS